MLLGKIFKNIDNKYKKIKFKEIRFHSKECKYGDIFFSIKGNNLNGNHFIQDAIKNGAKIIISNIKTEGFNKKGILFLHNKNPRMMLSYAASLFFKDKPKNIVAITGTNGKTSVSNFYYQILNLNNIKVASIGTLGVISKKLILNTNNTTLDPISIHKNLQILKKKGVENVILEASSHGLKQLRLNNIKFNTAIFTNLSRDHIDYHKTFKDYLNSKLILFKNLLNYNGNIVFDETIKQSPTLNKIVKKRKLKKYDYGANHSFVNILSIKKLNDRKKIVFLINKKKYSFTTSLIGKVQIKNLMFAIIAAYLSKLKINKIIKSIKKIQSIDGRLQKIGKIKNKSKVILDYAHTPDALETILLNIKDEFPLSEISLVFGCGGNRDKDKRKMMGKIANSFCEKIYLTNDNPRSENPIFIRNEIKKGIQENKICEIASRSKAIHRAINELKSGNILVVAGKGHENYQEFKTKIFFSDKLEILKAIRKKNLLSSNSLKTNILKENLKNLKINNKILINSASMNSKRIGKKTIFIGIKGKKYDGNLFVNEAIKNKAPLAISNIKSKNPKVIFEKNPLKVFQNLSLKYRKSLNANNVAITGSAGKTSVKELLAHCLQQLENTYCSKYSYNNKFGVPLSIFNTPQNSKFSVLEVGMDKIGEIGFLTKIIRPDIGLITNISHAHIKNFKNINQIAHAKSEIIPNIIPNGTIVINKDDNFHNVFIKKARKYKIKIITFSKKYNKADITFLNKKKNKNNYLFFVQIFKKTKVFLISKELIHFKENILSCLCILSNYFDIDKLAKNLFLNFKVPKSRGDIMIYRKGSKKVTIINESYNSNPLSFKFALERFDMNYKNSKKKYLLIGDMLELGKYSKKLHIKIAEYINKSGINKTFTYGNLTNHTFNKLKPQIRGKIINNKVDILNLINNEIPDNSFLMIKGSNSTGLSKIIDNLI